MSGALMSWRAVTAILSILLRRIRSTIELVKVNIVQNRRGEQTADLIAARGSARKRGADLARRDRLRCHRHARDRSGERAFQARGIGGEPPLPMDLQRRGQTDPP